MYHGNFFNVETGDNDDWKIGRFSDDGEYAEIVLSAVAMDELRDYFSTHYAEDRKIVTDAKIAAMREP
jgi:hypothetical protein